MNTVFLGLLAFGAGVALVIALFVPWLAREYRRYGRFSLGRAVVAFAAVVYALALLTYTLLPIPDTVGALCQSPPQAQLQLFAFVDDIAKEGGIHGPRDLLTNPAAQQVLLNVLLFVPFGMLVRHVLARRRVVAGLAIGLAMGGIVSLLIETTQLTGDWFIYPCAYRLFDVDDLLANAIGAGLGTFCSPVLRLVVGSDERVLLEAPRPVTVLRRLLGMLSDVLTMWLSSIALSVGVSVAWILIDPSRREPGSLALLAALNFVGPAIQLAIVVTTGRTIGEHVVRLRPSPVPGFGRRLVRWALGSGGWATLLALDVPDLVVVSWVWGLSSLIAVWFTRGRRGLALAVVRTSVEDDRSLGGTQRCLPEGQERSRIPRA